MGSFGRTGVGAGGLETFWDELLGLNSTCSKKRFFLPNLGGRKFRISGFGGPQTADFHNAYRARRLKFPVPGGQIPGLITQPPMHIMRRKHLQSRDLNLKRAPLFFSGSPALIPDLIFPVEAGIGGSHRASATPYFLNDNNGNRQFLCSRQTLKLVARNNSQWLSLCGNSKVRRLRGHVCCVQM